MKRWAIGLALASLACSAKDAEPETLVVPDGDIVSGGGATEARGLQRAPTVPPLRRSYEKVPQDWDPATLYIDDKPAENAVACLYDPNTLLAQMTHRQAETVYTVSLRHPPMMTTSSEGFTDDADWVRTETTGDSASYEARFGTDHDDFRATTVKLVAPVKLRPCRPE